MMKELKNQLKQQLLEVLEKHREERPHTAIYHLDYDLLNRKCSKEITEYYSNHMEVFQELYEHLLYGTSELDRVKTLSDLFKAMQNYQMDELLNKYLLAYEELTGEYVDPYNTEVCDPKMDKIIELIKRG